jgi:hypothetical protein
MELLKKIFICHICGSHDWTSNALQDKEPTKEQIDAGIDGFWDYAKMYCKRCEKESELNHMNKNGKDI